MPSHFFDAVIIGSDPAGLVAGALLARRGYRILQIDVMEQPGSYVRDGYPLPCGPVLMPPFFENSRPFTVVSRELAMSPSTFSELGLPVSRIQSLLPGHRVDLWHDRDSLLVELFREFPKETGVSEKGLADTDRTASELRALLEQDAVPLPPDGFWEGRRLSKAISQLGSLRGSNGLAGSIKESASLSRILCSPLDFVTGAHDSASIPAGALALSRVLSPGWQVVASMSRIKAALRKRLKELGVIMLSGPPPAHLHLNGARISGLTLKDSSHTYNCAGLIVASSLFEIEDCLPHGRRIKKIQKASGSTFTDLCMLALNMIVPARTVPEGMGRVVLLSNAPSASKAARPILLCVMPAFRNKVLQKDEVLINASMIVEKNKLNNDRAKTIAVLKSTLLERMARPFPFIVEKTSMISTPYDAEKMSDMGRDMPIFKGIFEPTRLLSTEGLTAGIFRLPARMGFENLFIASREVLPGMGLEGEFVCARTVADLISRLDPKKG